MLRRTDLPEVPKGDPWVGGRVKPDFTSLRCPNYKPKLSDLKLLTVDPEELEKRNEEIKGRFVEFFGA